MSLLADSPRAGEGSTQKGPVPEMCGSKEPQSSERRKLLNQLAKKGRDSVLLEALKQSNEDHRHYGRLRWQIATAYTAFSIAMLALGLHDKVFHTAGFFVLFVAAIGLGIGFSILEYRINRGLEDFVEDVKQIEEVLRLRPPGAVRTDGADEHLRRDFAPYLVVTIYVGVIGLWAAALYFRTYPLMR